MMERENVHLLTEYAYLGDMSRIRICHDKNYIKLAKIGSLVGVVYIHK